MKGLGKQGWLLFAEMTTFSDSTGESIQSFIRVHHQPEGLDETPLNFDTVVTPESQWLPYKWPVQSNTADSSVQYNTEFSCIYRKLFGTVCTSCLREALWHCVCISLWAACQLYTAVNTLSVSVDPLVETYLPFPAVTSRTTNCLAWHMKVMDESFPSHGVGLN